MLSTQIIFETLACIRKETDVSLRVYTPTDLLVTPEGVTACERYTEIASHIPEDADPGRYDGHCYFHLKDSGTPRMLLECDIDDRSFVVGRMAALQFKMLLSMDEDRYDTDNFFKNLLLDNLLTVDIYSRANTFHIDTKVPRVAFLIEVSGKADGEKVEFVRALLDDQERNFVTALSENEIVLVKELRSGESAEELREIADTIVDNMNTEMMDHVMVSYGNTAKEIREVANSYKEAKLALSVGKIFTPERNVIPYSALGIGRLIYQLPLPMCRLFIKEIFGDLSPDQLDDETINTIDEFFANNLNVSEASRRLYIHRNTLAYRLNKIREKTGLDLQNFDDAITFKIALMVTRYMRYMGDQNGKK
jgi:carbohydrate diacid regulator